jgi:hypothetical protein
MDQFLKTCWWGCLSLSVASASLFIVMGDAPIPACLWWCPTTLLPPEGQFRFNAVWPLLVADSLSAIGAAWLMLSRLSKE